MRPNDALTTYGNNRKTATSGLWPNLEFAAHKSTYPKILRGSLLIKALKDEGRRRFSSKRERSYSSSPIRRPRWPHLEKDRDLSDSQHEDRFLRGWHSDTRRSVHDRWELRLLRHQHYAEGYTTVRNPRGFPCPT